MRRAALLALCAAFVAWIADAPAALGDVFGPISLVSASAVSGSAHNQQADYANDAVISGDGRYVAFDGSFGGRTGVFRRDLQSGEVATVAEDDATLPSISEDGRYISFTTTARLDEQHDTNSAPDVYVRDMQNPDSAACPSGWEEAGQQCAFALASAVDGSSQGLAYHSETSFEETHRGSLASGRSALSADGRRVAFVTTAVSNLANPDRPDPSGSPEEPQTPALQVAVRDLDTKQTILVSQAYDPSSATPAVNAFGQPEPVPTADENGLTYGAVFPGGSLIPNFPAASGGASISADGSTVAWMGQQIASQARVLSVDPALSADYSEPLWRRIADGPGALTRRITGGSDPLSPACQSSGETQLVQPATLSDPCRGPFDTALSVGGVQGVLTAGVPADYLPRLSANGMTVAFLANAREIASGEEFRTGESSDDLYVANMDGGLTRVQALRRLTELAGGDASDQARVAPLVDVAVSPDGSQIAFATKRTVFPQGAPAFVSAPAAAVGTVELFDADLADETLTRVTQGFDGQPSEVPSGVTGVTASPSFSADGNLLAFSSNADNLAYGDGNKASDAFTVSRLRFSSAPTPQEVSSAPASPLLAARWELGVTAVSRRDGSVLLEVQVPGAGALRLGAQSAVRVRVKARGAHRARVRSTVLTRTVATRLAHPSASGLLAQTLKLARPFAGLATARGGLSSTVTVTFSAPGHPLLRRRIAVTFLRTFKSRRKAKAKAKAHRSGRAR